MKNLILVLTLMMGYACYAQSNQIMIKNNTPCIAYFTLRVASSANPCGAPSINTSVVSLASGATITYTGTTYPGYTPGSIFNYFYTGRFYNTNPTSSCSMMAANVGEPCSGLPLFQPLTWLNSNCGVCRTGFARWYPATIPMGLIVVDLN